VASGGQPGSLIQTFLLTTPVNTSEHFNLNFTATSVEKSNGDTQDAVVVLPINIDHSSHTVAATFSANDQSIWDTGNAFTFSDDRFLGFDTGSFHEQTGTTIYAEVDGHVRAGFQSTLTFNGGEIDATSKYDLTVDSTYNHTTDSLYLDTSAALTGSDFATTGPQGSYLLAFVYDLALHAAAGAHVGSFVIIPSIDTDLYPDVVFPGVDADVSFGVSESGSYNILNIDSHNLGATLVLPKPFDAFSIDFAWPTLDTSGHTTSSGESNNFLQLNVDIDQLIADIVAKGVNPFDLSASAGPLSAEADLLNFTATAGMNFLQQFALSLGKVQGTLLFEDGSKQAFTFGDKLLIGNASAIDAAGNHDGHVDFKFEVAPDATLQNATSLGFNIGAGVSIGTFTLDYGLGSASLGPVATAGVTLPLGSVPVYDHTFSLHYTPVDYIFGA
jgi:hypothetical protein